jgi:rRNA pseudouridine-1189 N-methylase Emg1 (Nep1/Mra1 family)
MTVGKLWQELMNLNSEKARFVMMNLFEVTQNELTQFLSENKDVKIILEKK